MAVGVPTYLHTDEFPETTALHAGPRAGELGAPARGDQRDGRLLPDPAARRAALPERPRVGSDHLSRVLPPDDDGFFSFFVFVLLTLDRVHAVGGSNVIWFGLVFGSVLVRFGFGSVWFGCGSFGVVWFSVVFWFD